MHLVLPSPSPKDILDTGTAFLMLLANIYDTYYWGADDGHSMGFNDVTVSLENLSAIVNISAESCHTFLIKGG